jgi:hypothetical protein
MRPDLRQQGEINRVDSLDVLIEEKVNGQIIDRRRAGVGGRGASQYDSI